MLNINFVPDEYIQNRESRRTNTIYLVLLILVMACLGSSFAVIKVRQGIFQSQERILNEKITREKESIRRIEELQSKRNSIWRAALTTAELLEPVSKSVLLALLTNSLPPGVSLERVKIVQKEPSPSSYPAPTSKYEAEQAKKQAAQQSEVPHERLLDTAIDIEGIAPSDLQVAAYIAQLSNLTLLENVALVESMQQLTAKSTGRSSGSAVGSGTEWRQFKLTALLKGGIHLMSEDVESVKTIGKESSM